MLPNSAMRGTRAARRRVAFYSHDTMGLGHMRRNLLLAETLAQRSAGTDVLGIAGSREAAIFGARRGIDCVTLPALQKRSTGSYHARHLDVPLGDLVALRSRIIAAAVDAFAPDLFVVDNVPRGAEGELNATLEALRGRGRGRLVLGLRDVLDAPATIRAEWGRARNEEAIRRYYDAVWVYGDRAVYDLPHEYGLAPDIARMLRYRATSTRSSSSSRSRWNCFHRRSASTLSGTAGTEYLRRYEKRSHCFWISQWRKSSSAVRQPHPLWVSNENASERTW